MSKTYVPPESESDTDESLDTDQVQDGSKSSCKPGHSRSAADSLPKRSMSQAAAKSRLAAFKMNLLGSSASSSGTEQSKLAKPDGIMSNDNRSTVTPVSLKSLKELGAIKMTIGSQKQKEPTTAAAAVKRPSGLISAVFNPDDESDEDMPPEAKMRMRNLGKDTKTAEGPNSFSKGRLGFCNRQKIMQRELEKINDT